MGSNPAPGLNFLFQDLIGQLLKLCVWLRWSIMTSYLSPQFKYMIFHIFISKIFTAMHNVALANVDLNGYYNEKDWSIISSFVISSMPSSSTVFFCTYQFPFFWQINKYYTFTLKVTEYYLSVCAWPTSWEQRYIYGCCLQFRRGIGWQLSNKPWTCRFASLNWDTFFH